VKWQPEAVRRTLSGVLQHGLEVVGDDAIERRLLGPAGVIVAGQRFRRGASAAFERVLRCVRTGHSRRTCARNATNVSDRDA
jgi:hypothetical protein